MKRSDQLDAPTPHQLQQEMVGHHRPREKRFSRCRGEEDHPGRIHVDLRLTLLPVPQRRAGYTRLTPRKESPVDGTMIKAENLFLDGPLVRRFYTNFTLDLRKI